MNKSYWWTSLETDLGVSFRKTGKIIIPMAAASLASAIVIFLCFKKLKAYTGDCCGACFIISELTFYIAALVIFV